jgi:predicted phage replisome organizer
MADKKYFWFKMEDDFFQKKEIKKLRSIAGGDTFVIIYLKIILLSLKSGGKLYYEGIDETFIEELALEIDEKKDNVGVTVDYLLRHSAVLQIDDNEYKVNTINNLIGGETSSAIRVRKHREKVKLLQCNADVTPVKQIVNTEIEIEKELKKEKKKDGTLSPARPTLQEIKEYIALKNYSVNPDKFFEWYETAEWKDNKGKPIKNWKLKLLSWHNRDEEKRQPVPSPYPEVKLSQK